MVLFGTTLAIKISTKALKISPFRTLLMQIMHILVWNTGMHMYYNKCLCEFFKTTQNF